MEIKYGFGKSETHIYCLGKYDTHDSSFLIKTHNPSIRYVSIWNQYLKATYILSFIIGAPIVKPPPRPPRLSLSHRWNTYIANYHYLMRSHNYSSFFITLLSLASRYLTNNATLFSTLPTRQQHHPSRHNLAFLWMGCGGWVWGCEGFVLVVRWNRGNEVKLVVMNFLFIFK